MIVCSTEGILLDCHPKEMTDDYLMPPHEFLGKSIDEVAPEYVAKLTHDNIEKVLQTRTKSYATYEITIQKEKRYYEIRYTPMGENRVLSTMRNITELRNAELEGKRLEEQLHQTQKLEALGRLSGGIAHDFNNALAGIIGAAEILTEEHSKGEEKEFVTLILTAANRATDLTKKLLTFSRAEVSEKYPLDAQDIVTETVALLGHTVDRAITLNTEITARDTTIIGNTSLLQNALMNMGINASHAIEKTGTITFSLKNTHLDKEYCLSSPFNIEEGDYLEIGVRDTGCGMSPDISAHIFEPFFTTKPTGEGTGLGLAAVYGAVQEHAGAITVYSEPGQGTIFYIYLPLAEPLSLPVQEKNRQLPRGTETILIIDDEELIRKTASHMLESLGFTVLTASNGREGIELFQKEHHRIDGIILDMIMPVMGGQETFSLLRDVHRDIPIIISSGFTKEKDMEQLRAKGRVFFLHKPFKKFDLAELVLRACRN